MSFFSFNIIIKIRIIVSFFQRFINQMITPFMAIYLASHFGVTITGILVLIMILSGIIVSFYGGHFSDSVGRRSIILMSEFINIFIFTLMALANSPWFSSPLITYFLFILLNAFTSFSKPALDAIIIDVSTPQIRKEIYSISYWTVNLSLALGAMIGAWFYRDHFFQILIFAAISNLIIFFVYFIFIKESRPTTAKDRNSTSSNNFKGIVSGYKSVLNDNLFVKFIIVSILVMGIEYQLAHYISIRLANEFNYFPPLEFLNIDNVISGVEVYGILRVENTIGVVILGILLKRAFNKVPDRIRIYIGTMLFTIGYVFLGASNYFWVLIISMLIVTIGELIYVPIQQTILSIIIDDNNRTKYLAVYGLHQRFAIIIASLFIILGSFLPSSVISILYGVMGILAIFLYKNILNQSTYKKKTHSL